MDRSLVGLQLQIRSRLPNRSHRAARRCVALRGVALTWRDATTPGSLIDMTSEDLRTRVLELFEVVINGRDVDAIPRFTAKLHIDATRRSPLTAFSDPRFEVRWMVVEGRRVVAFVDMSGTLDSGPGSWLPSRHIVR